MNLIASRELHKEGMLQWCRILGAVKWWEYVDGFYRHLETGEPITPLAWAVASLSLAGRHQWN